MSFWFIGTGEFAALVLPLLAKNFEFSHVITKKPRIGNRLKEEITPVEREAAPLALPIFRTDRLSSDDFLKGELEKNPPEIIFVIDFGEIIKEPFLNGARLGCWNIHPSLLPKYRGAAPIQRALENGDEEIGVTLFRLVKEMDAGGIIAQAKEKISDSANALDVMARMAVLGCELAALTKNAKNAKISLEIQNDSDATFANKISKEECHQSFDIDARLLHNRVRAFFPSPCAWVDWGGKRLKLIETSLDENDNAAGHPVVKCMNGSIVLKRVQPEGKRIMSGAEWARGEKIKTGEKI